MRKSGAENKDWNQTKNYRKRMNTKVKTTEKKTGQPAIKVLTSLFNRASKFVCFIVLFSLGIGYKKLVQL